MFQQQRQRLDAARRQPPREALAATAGALRAMLAEVPPARRAEAEAVLARCETLLYAPTPSENAAEVEELLRRAISAAEQMRKDAE